MKIFTSILLLFSACVFGYGQIDAHYWTNQYGAKGLLLNGAVIAAPDDETSIFYNPGAMPLDDNLGFAFSFLSPTFSRLTTGNYLGDGEKLRDDDLGLSPGFLAVRFKPFKTDNIVMGLTTFQRFVTDISFKDRIVSKLAGENDLLFRGDLNFKRKISQDWFGIGISYKISDHIGIGVSQFSVWHDENLIFDFKKEIVQSGFPENIVQGWRSEFNYDYSIYSSFVTKAGISVNFDRFCLGVVYTTPSYSPLRSGASYSFENQKVFSDGTILSASNRNDTDLNDYKIPRSIGGGLEIHFNKLAINLSAEWFEEIPPYTVFEDQDDSYDGIAIGPSETNINIITGNADVLNFAVGIQQDLSKHLTALVGFRTDFNQSNNLEINNTAEYLANTPDIFHVSGGVMYKYRKNLFSTGIDVGYGQRSGGRQLLDLTNVSTDNLFEISGKENVKSTFFSGMLFITYDFLFGGE